MKDHGGHLVRRRFTVRDQYRNTKAASNRWMLVNLLWHYYCRDFNWTVVLTNSGRFASEKILMNNTKCKNTTFHDVWNLMLSNDVKILHLLLLWILRLKPD